MNWLKDRRNQQQQKPNRSRKESGNQNENLVFLKHIHPLLLERVEVIN